MLMKLTDHKIEGRFSEEIKMISVAGIFLNWYPKKGKEDAWDPDESIKARINSTQMPLAQVKAVVVEGHIVCSQEHSKA